MAGLDHLPLVFYHRRLQTYLLRMTKTFFYTLPANMFANNESGIEFSSLPTRDQVLQWEAEKEQLLATIRTATAQLESLEAVIKAAWSVRTPAINDDLVGSILDYFSPPPPFALRHGDVFWENHAVYMSRTLTLSNLCRISRQWLRPCQVLLYHDIQPRIIQTTRKLTLSLDASPHLLPLIQRVLVAEAWKTIVPLVSQIPNVHSIWTEGKTFISDISALLHWRNMKSVMFSRGTTWEGDEWERAYVGWPKLKTLIFNGAQPGVVRSPTEAKFLSLRSIGWAGTSFTHSRVPALAAHTLQTIQLHNVHMIDGTALNILLDAHSESLQHLEIIGCSPIRTHTIAVAQLVFRGSLRRLRTYDNTPELFDPSDLPIGSLSDITVGWATCSPAQALQFMKSRASVHGSSLRNLEVRIDANHYGGVEEWASVTKTAKDLGVNLIVSQRPPLL